MNSKVLILILNWNKKEFVIELLNQIQSIEYENFECLVVDNNSDDGSVSAIKKTYPGINILENEKNLGGTGGYNSGLRYALDNIEADYIWMVDNDAGITSETLKNLVEVMDGDKGIGIAGSRIADTNQRDITIELGAFFNRKTIGVIPNFRNKKKEHFESKYYETDYVAVCSALVRVDALSVVGLMDERHFIFWDDMDWGLQFKRAGYRVVAVPSSIAYHPSFTERNRGITTDFYYGIRNPLLVYSKHFNPVSRLKIFFTFFTNYSMFMVLMLFNRRWNNLHFAYTALFDFIFNKWGKCEIEYSPQPVLNSINPEDIEIKKALVIFDSYSDDGLQIKEILKSINENIEICALVDQDRAEIYEGNFDNIIKSDPDKRKSNLLYNLTIFLKILNQKFDMSAGSNSSPFGYATKKFLIYNNNQFEDTSIDIYSIYKVFLSFAAGFILSLILTPAVFLSSFRYSRCKTQRHNLSSPTPLNTL